MNSNSSNTKRRQKDIHKLIMSNYEVIILNENKMNEMYIIFKGPGECPYEDVRDIILFYLLFNHLNYNFFYEKLFYIMKI
jgi:ubiquitin-protein ligase